MTERIKAGASLRELLTRARALGCTEGRKDGHVLLRHPLGEPTVAHQNNRRKDCAAALLQWLRRIERRLQAQESRS